MTPTRRANLQEKGRLTFAKGKEAEWVLSKPKEIHTQSQSLEKSNPESKFGKSNILEHRRNTFREALFMKTTKQNQKHPQNL